METAKTPNIKSAALTANDKSILDRHLSKYTAFTVDEKEIAGFFNGGYGSFRLQIDEELDWTISLELNDLRDPDYKAFYITEEGEVEITEPFVVNTFKGETSAGQHVRFTIDENTFFGIIFGENYHYVIRSAKDYTQNKGDNSFIVYKSWDIIPDDNFSDYINDALEVPKEGKENIVAGAMTRADSKSLKIATDADYDLYSVYSSGTNSFILTVINSIEGVYYTTFGLRLYVTDQYVFTTTSTTPTYPYTSTDSSTLLGQFRTYWNTYRTGVNRHIAHLFTGKTLGGGIMGRSWVGAINGNTSGNYAYALSMNRTDMYQTTAHEIGHNLNALDNPSDGSCDTPSRSVMCQGPLKASSLWFSTQSQNLINSFLSSNSSALSYILGPSSVTYGTNYSLQNAPPGTISWSKTGSLSVSSSGNTATVFATGTGSGTLTVMINNGIVNRIVAEKTISAYQPLITGPSTVYTGSTVYYNLPYETGASYNWSSGGTLTLVSNGSATGTFNVPYNASGSNDVVYCTVTLNGVLTHIYNMSVNIY